MSRSMMIDGRRRARISVQRRRARVEATSRDATPTEKVEFAERRRKHEDARRSGMLALGRRYEEAQEPKLRHDR